jgi:hypothetical protein
MASMSQSAGFDKAGPLRSTRCVQCSSSAGPPMGADRYRSRLICISDPVPSPALQTANQMALYDSQKILPGHPTSHRYVRTV